ncbi:transglutaminase-like domain-containing protein [Blastopirellula sp. JC732]|uniref:Transglutaminase-like domain-containing protein n=1 Tax=Blastopirellula sediminis TaxID=2894196 RepID=A0A9X1MKE5_9BACT|nr:transglutaminase-like domain-containing protein [Blastopirellula sediminis]MCC9609333.1 transglutaminase-like domain-containing protein [Blastopirellula sediminis]MCC9627890.1 transglutaminase-like domain-containing protein [Blastopirellula sediminis]
MRQLTPFAVVALLLLCSSQLLAQFEAVQPSESKNAPILGDARTSKYRVGIEIEAVGGDCVGLYGTIPVPADWPEQTVRLMEEDVSNESRIGYRMLENSVKQLMVSVPSLRRGQTARAVITLEVETRSAKPPEDLTGVKIPKRPPSDIRRYLGSSPSIESRHSSVRKKAREILDGVDGDWQKVEALYDWVRDNISYESQKSTTAVTALRKGSGDFEDLTGLFIALCRASDIPARTVWVPGSSYAEFYLEDANEEGHWYPAQVTGPRAFGYMPDPRPILQKGDSFRVPEKTDPVRFVAEYLTGKKSPNGGKPQVTFIREEPGS